MFGILELFTREPCACNPTQWTSLFRIHNTYVHLSCMYTPIALIMIYSEYSRSQSGILNVCYPASELEKYTGTLSGSVQGWKQDDSISLREAARKQSPWSEVVANACKCTTGCATRKCRCMKQGIGCSSHCHGAKPCSNTPCDEK